VRLAACIKIDPESQQLVAGGGLRDRNFQCRPAAPSAATRRTRAGFPDFALPPPLCRVWPGEPRPILHDLLRHEIEEGGDRLLAQIGDAGSQFLASLPDLLSASALAADPVALHDTSMPGVNNATLPPAAPVTGRGQRSQRQSANDGRADPIMMVVAMMPVPGAGVGRAGEGKNRRRCHSKRGGSEH
jgi:hypothetical protein